MNYRQYFQQCPFSKASCIICQCCRLDNTLQNIQCGFIQDGSSTLIYGYQSPWTIQFMEFSRPEYWSGQPFPSPGDLPKPSLKPWSPTLQADSLPAEPQGKPKNTGVGSLSLLQQIFPTQESNWGLLYYRQILYQLSYQGSPIYLSTGNSI